ncbi:hypothetical protein IIZ81_03560 [Candidatus Saccharibacteria bacterium]|nr:hypothetical protein [Candidatus Saccharibacteria bacterium]
MRNNFKYKVSLLAIAAIFFSAIALSTNAFADSLDITITNQIDFTLLEQDSNNATISDIQITNNSDTTSILLTNIKASAATGYTLESFNSSFNTFRANSKHIGIAYDLASGARDISGRGITTTETIGTSASKTLAFTGKSSIFTTAITAEDNEYMADIVLTLETIMTDYSVTWDMNGGTEKSGASYPNTLTPGQKVDLSQIEPTRSDWIFDHWEVSSAGSASATEYLTDAGLVDLNPGLASSITVKAFWRKKSVTLFTGSGNVNNAMWYTWTWADGESGHWVAGDTLTGAIIHFEDLSNNIIFARMDPAAVANNNNQPDWSAVWNKSSDIKNFIDGSTYTHTGWDDDIMVMTEGPAPIKKYSVTLIPNAAAAMDNPKWYIHSYGTGVPLDWYAGTYVNNTIQFSGLGNRVQFVRMDPNATAPCMTASINDPDCTQLWNKSFMLNIQGSTFTITDFIDCADGSGMLCLSGTWSGDITYETVCPTGYSYDTTTGSCKDS